MPASPQRRTRSVAPVPAIVPDVVVEPEDVVDVPVRRRRSSTELRRLQAATADPKKRLPKDKAATELSDDSVAATIAGKSFRLKDAISMMPLMEWAAALDMVDSQNVSQLSSQYRLLKSIVDPADWDAFRVHVTEQACSLQDFVDFQNAAVEAIVARPTKEPAAS